MSTHPTLISIASTQMRTLLAAVIDKALVRNPKDRFQDAGKLLAAVR